MLPIEEVLPALQKALADHPCVVLVAPPGAGKTTVTPLELLKAPWVSDGRIVVLEPRRLAARAAAARMASTLGEPVGSTVGYRVRLDAKVSAKTRIEVVTEGVFTRRLLGDPGLEGIAAVLIDEFHERSLEGDLGLALARDSQSVLRPDLKLLVMSATLEGARVSALLGDAPIVESRGRLHPVETEYLGADPGLRLEERAARAVRKALAEEVGGVLVFLPGQGEILRTADLLTQRPLPADVDITPLYGALDAREQDRAIAPPPAGRRKVVLATDIAQTSLTIEGVRVVIDAGLSRAPRYDPASNLARLETVRVSRASAEQRRGRAGRTQPGVCYRLWDEPQTRSLPAFDRPEILDADLARLALDLAAWGARDTEGLAFLDPPPKGALTEARALLTRFGALGADGGLTAHGEALAALPLPPRLAQMVLRAGAFGQADRAALIASVLMERGLGGRDTDLTHRLSAFERDRSQRAQAARSQAARWTRQVAQDEAVEPVSDGVLLGIAFPERVAKARGKGGEFQLAGGRGVFLEPTDALAREPWLAVAELGGGAARDRILLAAPIDEADLRSAFVGELTQEDRLDTVAGKLRARRILRFGRLVLEDRPIDEPDPALIRAGLLALVREQGLTAVPMGEGASALRARVGFLRRHEPSDWPDLSDEALLADLDTWLPPLLAGRSALSQITDHELVLALRERLDWPQQQALQERTPERFTAPTGSRVAIDYASEGGPRVDIRVQELFGLAIHPTVDGEPLTLALLSPAHHPVALTRDLPAFWKAAWADVRKDMRGRYPRHPWPEDPSIAEPTSRAKPRGT